MAVVPSAAENLSNKFFQKHDPARTLRDYRNFIPKIVLEKFCSGNEQSTLVFVDQYQVYVFVFSSLLSLLLRGVCRTRRAARCCLERKARDLLDVGRVPKRREISFNRPRGSSAGSPSGVIMFSIKSQVAY